MRLIDNNLGSFRFSGPGEHMRRIGYYCTTHANKPYY
jgi:hypothetical protein